MNKISKIHIDNYFKRFASRETILAEPLNANCEIIIVIPCHNEPNLIGTLESLIACQIPSTKVEVIIVVNQKAGIEKTTTGKQNAATILTFESWNKKHKCDHIAFHLIQALDMPHKQAGVGLARKIGMDEALRRFNSITLNGTLVCLDADCSVSQNYLTAIEKEFVRSSAGLGEVQFEHRYELEPDIDLRSGIINYELFLYYYVAGLKKAGFPYAIQTIGSCMLVKSSAYAKHGGMNKRKAGEDFYFLHKIMPHELFVEVEEAKVYPSCRTSDRVPFGTGKAQQDWLDQSSKDYMTYNPKVFDQLKLLIDSLDALYLRQIKDVVNQLPEIPKAFLLLNGFDTKISMIKSNCKDFTQFQKQFFIWFDGFICMKFVHFVRDNYFPNIPIAQAASVLTQLKSSNSEVHLKAFRAKTTR